MYKSDIAKADRTTESQGFPDVLLIDNTSACNLRCSMCDHKNMKKYRKIMRMDWNLYTRLMDEVALENPKARIWQIFYGDPFVCHDMPQRIKYSKDKGLKDVVLNTNGVLMKKEKARAIIEAACELTKKGIKVYPEIMIPLIGTKAELANQKKVVDAVAQEVMDKYGIQVEYAVGTMIEIPRAALTADEVAEVAEFFSFGTNDLTQMTFGFSRDDAGKFLPGYIENGILPKDPFQTIDESGIGQLVDIGIKKGRSTKKDLKVGICGEHGGDPASVEFCHKVGMNYVSCSPFRVPIARLAAAQAVLKEKK